jgi:hypothetical protein
MSEYFHAARQHFDDLNDSLQLTDGSAAVHPHVLALVLSRGLSIIIRCGRAKQCVIYTLDTNFIMSKS